MTRAVVDTPVRIAACGCLTAFGDEKVSHAALVRGETALRLLPVLGDTGGENAPLALRSPMSDTDPARWVAELAAFDGVLRDPAWGRRRTPAFVTSSNFGVDGLYAHTLTKSAASLRRGIIAHGMEDLRRDFGWGDNVTVLSHACVSAQLGLMHAARVLERGEADRVLVFSYDFLSPFVAGGFHALKILNPYLPAPYAKRASGSIGLGDGAAYAVLTRDTGDFAIRRQHCHNEMWHFTSNDPTGAGFTEALAPFSPAAGAPAKVWFKGHGTGTLEPGALECAAADAAFPGAPVAGWKGGLGHTLGSCALVELAIGLESFRTGIAPGTVGTTGECFSENVATAAFPISGYDGAVMACNAFGGAHAAMLVTV